MVYQNLNLPATLVHSVNGKKYTLNGKLLAINESTKLATMQFGDKVSSNIPLSELYLNEASIKDIMKKAGKKVKDAAISTWNYIKDIVKVIGGLLIPVDEQGNELKQFINAPINLSLMNLPKAVKVMPTQGVLDLYDEVGVHAKNNVGVDAAFEQSLSDEKKEIETYWTRVMKEYAKSENESLTLSDTVKMVNEKYYHETIDSKVLNESAIPSLKSPSGLYGETVGTNELVGMVISNIKHQLNPIENKVRTDEDIINQLRGSKNYVKPLLIWGAPGIGKTAILKQAANYFKGEESAMNLDMVTVCCGGIKVDDFELPDTAKNYVGQKVAISTPKTWLPVFSIASLTDEQLLETNDFYNSGRFRILAPSTEQLSKTYKDEDGEVKKVIDWKSVGTGKTYDGGIIFFDEFARLRNLKTMDTMMTLCGDRTYVDMPLATNWVTVAAANRLSDDLLSEANKDFHDLWDAAKQSRFTHLTYAPTKKEWLDWARDVDEHGYQNVDELICKFIEKSPDGVWYDALSLGSREIEGRNANDLKQILDKWEKGIALTAKELKVFGTYIENPGNSIANMSNYTWNGRTWHQKIHKAIMSLLLNDFFNGDFEKYEACFDETQRVKDLYGSRGSKEYTAKNLNMNKVAEQLNSIPNQRWDDVTNRFFRKVDPNQNLRNNDRLGFFLACVQWYIQVETGGEESVPTQAWKHYNSIDSIIEQSDIRSIYEKGRMKSKAADRNDNIIFDQTSEYNSINDIKWKADITLVDEVVSMVLDAFSKYITPAQILTDIERIKKNLANIAKDPDKWDVKQAEIDNFINHYTLHLTNADGKEIKTIPTFLSKELENQEDAKKFIIILRNSKCAEMMANLAMWVSKISLQIGNNSPLFAALGQSGKQMAPGTIGNRFGSIIRDNPKVLAVFNDNNDNTTVEYDLCKPAMNILNTMSIID